MARKTTKTTETKKEETEKATFGVPEIAEATGLQEASVRAALRDSDFEKDGKYWDFPTKTAQKEVLNFFKERSDRKPNMEKEKEEPTETKKTRSTRRKK